ncbi:unnamed protein product [Cylicocyclus nassatus]|uniref:Histone deacetylase domain-containing protein n=1 Tax=Cylicocyclus nassatus TaxID=53992 RepID=A0AA36MCP4_CYLNA|nr:unnamed protein product [Cylicocyclus nassatus]
MEFLFYFQFGKMYFISDKSMLDHYCPWDTYHIEVPERLSTILEAVQDPELSSKIEFLPLRSATEQDLEMVHTRKYISDIGSTKQMSTEEQEEFCSNYEDIYVNKHTFDTALLAAGCTFQLVDAVCRTDTPGFAAIRPPGHHAFPDRGCGFCIFNNVALAAKYALKQGNSRVLIVDWDVHAGQGTQECIADDDRILLISIHRFENGNFWPNLEQSAVKTKFKNTINVPLNATGMGDSDYLAIFQLVVHPVINDFKPDIILVSCGFDAALGDPEGEMRLTPAGYGTLTHQLLSWGIPLALILEGGYFLDSIAADFKFVAKALVKQEIPPVTIQPLNAALPPVLNRIHSEYGVSFPSLTMIREIKLMLNSKDNPENNAEFQGKREFSLPFPTRGLYEKRPDQVIQDFKDELQSIISSYDTPKPYKAVHLMNQDNQMSTSCTDLRNGFTLQITKEMEGIVNLLISQSVNPLLPSTAFNTKIDRTTTEQVVKLLQEIQSAGIPQPYIMYL